MSATTRADGELSVPVKPRRNSGVLRSTRALQAFVAATGLALAVYILNAAIGVVSPASTWGIWYGTLATVLLVAALAYGLRRRTLAVRRVGPSRVYLLIHLYGGALFLVLALMHSGFSTPQGPLTWILWVLSLWVVGTGILGVALQKWSAAALAQLTTEVQLGRVGDLGGELRDRADQVARDAGGLIQDFYASELAPVMGAPAFRWRSLAGFVDDRSQRFAYMASVVADNRRDDLDELRRLVRANGELDVHFAVQSVLRNWLWLHVPTAIMLTALLGLHIAVTLYY